KDPNRRRHKPPVRHTHPRPDPLHSDGETRGWQHRHPRNVARSHTADGHPADQAQAAGHRHMLTGPPRPERTRTPLGVTRLAFPELLVDIEATADGYAVVRRAPVGLAPS